MENYPLATAPFCCLANGAVQRKASNNVERRQIPLVRRNIAKVSVIFAQLSGAHCEKLSTSVARPSGVASISMCLLPYL